MKYTEQQRQIVSLCRKYRDVKVDFTKNRPWCIIRVNDNEFFFGWSSSIDEVSKWLSENATLKSKSAPRKKGVTKKKVAFYLSEETAKDVAELAERHGITKSNVIKMAVSAALSLPAKAPCKHCLTWCDEECVKDYHEECDDYEKKY